MTEPYQDHPDTRAELVAFLESAFKKAEDGVGNWAERIAHWWDRNPFAAQDSRRGWIVREPEQGRIVGFLGLIPGCYAVNGQPQPALLPTTWVISEPYQKALFGFARRLHRLGQERLIVITTGRESFQRLMIGRGWVHQGQATRLFLPFGRLGCAWLPPIEPLSSGRRIISSTDELHSCVRAFRHSDGIEKWITADYLKWYLKSPGGKQRFFGVVDQQGQLSSYLILAPKGMCAKQRTWSVLDWFTCEVDSNELMVLLSAILARPADLGMVRPWFLRLVQMEGDSTWSEVRGLQRSGVVLNHLHYAPPVARQCRKRWVLAEGDLGL